MSRFREIETDAFRIIVFLASQGLSLRELWDYEDGATLAQILTFNVEVGRLSLIREKREINAMTVALASLFDQKVLSEYNAKTDSLIAQFDPFDSTPQSAEMGSAPAAPPPKNRNAVIHTVNELNKLNVLLRRA